MGVGAIFLALNIAPTQEVELISGRIGPWTAAMLAVASYLVLAAILATLDRGGGAAGVLRRSFAGYGLSLLISAYVLWTFGRLDDDRLSGAVEQIIVLALPAALGAGAARLMLGSSRDD